MNAWGTSFDETPFFVFRGKSGAVPFGNGNVDEFWAIILYFRYFRVYLYAINNELKI